jgi:dolichyl-phosphate beta-glucosyltransferase
MNYLVIPCFNEAERLQESEVLKCVNGLDGVVVLVNDGSTDGTLALLQKISSIHTKRIKVLNLERNVGKGEAVRAGFTFAIAQGATEIGFCDADFAVDHHDLSRIFIKLNESLTTYGVIGSRVAVVGSVIERSTIRHYFGRVFATLVSAILKQKIYDTQSGAKVFRVNPIIIRVFSIPFHI